MIEDVRQACENMHYPGMNFKPESLVDTFMDLVFKAWQAKMKGMEFAVTILKTPTPRRNQTWLHLKE